MNEKTLLKRLKEAQGVYEEHFKNKEFLYVYEENNQIKSFCINFSTSNFKHLTGVRTEKSAPENNAEIFYRSLKKWKVKFKRYSNNKFYRYKVKIFSKTLKLNSLPLFILFF